MCIVERKFREEVKYDSIKSIVFISVALKNQARTKIKNPFMSQKVKKLETKHSEPQDFRSNLITVRELFKEGISKIETVKKPETDLTNDINLILKYKNSAKETFDTYQTYACNLYRNIATLLRNCANVPTTDRFTTYNWQCEFIRFYHFLLQPPQGIKYMS